MADTFLFHDYETFGADPARDGIAQFAAVRTNTQLEVIADPIRLQCRLAIDRLPHPDACLITGLVPQDMFGDGLIEAEFAACVHEQMIEPATCTLGYNSIRFDDVFTRHLLWRNFHDPYAREWKNGNSRFDLIDLTRLCYALRPAGIEWPLREDGKASFRLEHLAKVNGIAQEHAHDALSDTYATLGLARLIRNAQPRLWEYALRLRDKRHVRGLLDWTHATPILHASEKYGAERGCVALVLPLGPIAGNDNAIVAIDLMADPTPLLECDTEELRDRLFTPRADLPEGIERPAIKAIHINRCPMLAPASVLSGVDLERIGLDLDRCEQHRHILITAPGLRAKLADALASDRKPGRAQDVELSLYDGAFPSPQEKARLDRARATPPAERGIIDFGFEDARHGELLFRQRARNWPELLSPDDQDAWREFVQNRLAGTHPLSTWTFDDYRGHIAQLRLTRPPGRDHAILDQLDEWANELERSWL